MLLWHQWGQPPNMVDCWAHGGGALSALPGPAANRMAPWPCATTCGADPAADIPAVDVTYKNTQSLFRPKLLLRSEAASLLEFSNVRTVRRQTLAGPSLARSAAARRPSAPAAMTGGCMWLAALCAAGSAA